MTNVDFAFLAVVAVFGLLGYLSGAIRQLAQWAGLAAAYFLARPLAAQLTPLLTPRLASLLPPKIQPPPAVVNMVLSSVLFCTLFLVGGIVLTALVSKLLGGHGNGKANKIGGVLLGAGKGAVILFAALTVILFLEKPLTQVFGGLPEPLAKSLSLGFTRAHNPLESAPLPALARLEKLMDAARDPNKAEALLKDPELRKMLDDPSLTSALKDGELQKALSGGDWSALKSDPRLAELLKDPRIAGAIDSDAVGFGAQR